MDVNSYAGIPLWDSQGKASGLLATLNQQEIEHIVILERILKIVSARAGAELERMIYQEALAEREKSYRRLYKETPVMMYSIDRRGKILSVSETWLEKMGYKQDEVVGRNALDFLTESSRLYAKEVSLPKLFKIGKVSDIPCQMVKKNGDIMDTLLSATAEFDNEGEFVRSLSVFIDVTEKNKLMKEQTRTAQLEALGTVVAGVAHEINNPINGVLNLATLLQSKSAGPEQVRDIASRILKESERIVRITSNLLHYSRDNQGERTIVDIIELVENALSLIAPKARPLGIQVQTDFERDNPKLTVNPQNIQQVVINLVDNAIYALRLKEQNKAEKTIDVRCCLVEKEQPMCCIEVSDNGIGMSGAIIRNAKNAFFSTKPSSEGTGLGLSIVNDIVQKHRGDFEIESREGEYTKMKVFLPVDQGLS
ncbi:PAS domain S-box protein [Candidatus Saccharibacteria bacterium]|nr:PAS domain S-box protein [Candidatus Saccharibacteria bacterium]